MTTRSQARQPEARPTASPATAPAPPPPASSPAPGSPPPPTRAASRGGTTAAAGWTLLTWAALMFLALLPVALLASYSFYVTAGSVREQVQAGNESAAALSAEVLSQQFEGRERLASAVAALPGMVDAVRRHDVEAVRERLRPMVKAFPSVERGYVLDPDGILWSDYPPSQSSLGSALPLYRELAASPGPYVSDVFQNDDYPRMLAIAVSAPVRDDRDGNKVIGVVAYQFRLDSITEWLKQSDVHGRYAFVLDRNGTVAAHPTLELRSREHKEFAALGPVRRGLAGEPGWGQFDDPESGQRMVAAFRPFKAGGGWWLVVAAQPLGQAYAPIGRLQAQIAMGAGIVAVAALAAALLLARSSAGIRRLGRALHERNANLDLERTKLRTLIDNLPDHIFIKDVQGRYVIDNAAHTRFVGQESSEQVIGKTSFDFFPREVAEKYTADDQQVIRSGVPLINREEPSRDDAGGTKWVSTTKVPVRDGSGAVFALVCISSDVTERKRAEEERGRLLAAEQAARAAAEAAARSEREAHEALKKAQSQMVEGEKLRALGTMVAGVAHEINNPLAFVHNNVVVLARDMKALVEVLELYRQAVDAPDEQRRQELAEAARELAERCDLGYTISNLDELLGRSREGLNRIQKIVRGLRDFARLDESDLQEADLNAGIESTLDIIRGNAKRKQVQIVTDLQRPLPPVLCHPAKINQVIMNLVSNAIDASPEKTTITVRSRGDGDGVAIEVEDQGTGIPPEVRERIFDPFFTTKPVGQGTGLGLSISYSIVKDHGGEILLASEEGKGSRFTVRLPRRNV